jgi:Fic family protein
MGLDKDIAAALKEQLQVLWTHDSTALEGNTLTLGETSFVIREGLTVSGKSLKDHEEVIGFWKATALIEDILNKELTPEDIFLLHKVVMVNPVMDIYKPVGAWKKEPNGTYIQSDEGIQWVEYPLPDKIPLLMDKWIQKFNAIPPVSSKAEAIKVYSELQVSFAIIHPFFDGNGRMARLLANMPLLKAGMPPVTIDQRQRKKYIDLMSSYSITEDCQIQGDMSEFEKFASLSYDKVYEIIDEAYAHQKQRNSPDQGLSM